MPRRTRPWIIEPEWYLRSISYSEYQQTGHWRQRRQNYRQARGLIGLDRTCDLCGEWELGDELNQEIPKWHVHHRRYENLGREPDRDLSLLCGPCHHLVHYPEAQQSQEWAEIRGGELLERAVDFRTEWDKVEH